MRANKRMMRRIFAICICTVLITPSFAQLCYGAQPSKEQAHTETEGEETGGETKADVVIRDTKDFVSFMENCKYDSWSIGKTVSLAEDLDLIGVNFSGVASFNGTFEGNGHTIRNVKLEEKGSDFGFFRYIGESGVVQNLHIEGTIAPLGSQENIGGIVGVNYGTITNCSFSGAVSGINGVGGIAGRNRETGTILSSSSSAVILATNNTGGIAGINDGKLADCKSTSSVNIEELDPTLDLAGMDVSAFNLTRHVVNRNDMGGIAGHSGGLITGCVNEGAIGYKHTGYNVGGIVGSQNGVLLDSTNYGEVYGRKDVGGIAGQAEPYVESEYLEDKLQQTKNDINRLNRTLNNISSAMSQTSSEVRRFTEDLHTQYQGAVNNISGNLQSIAGAIDNSNAQAQGYVDNIKNAWSNMEGLKENGGELTEEQVQQLQDNLKTIKDNLGNLQSGHDHTDISASELTNQLSSQLSNNSRTEDLKNLAITVDNGVQSITQNMQSAVNQMNQLAASASSDIEAMTSKEKVVTDISSVQTAEEMDGVISGCKNYGKIYGDLNVGGIAGTMNIEYRADPEFDLDFSGTLNITLRSTVNDVMIHCINYGPVTAKKNCAGGAIGLQELGFVYDCEGYGEVCSESGGYLGGIAGNSAASIEQSYSLCNVSGGDYIGGICGKGYNVKESISICDIASDGERRGSIAGFLAEEGTAENNCFVSTELHGIDNISYAGAAEQVSYESLMEQEDIPEGFRRITITFENEEGELLATLQIPYGGSITEADFPKMEEKEGCYIRWPGEKQLTNICSNLTIIPEYIPWQESVASKEKNEDGRPVILAVAQFYENTKLELREIEKPKLSDQSAEAAYAYAWELTGEQQKSYDTVEVHLIKPKAEQNYQVLIRQNGTWAETSFEEDGSYLTATIPYGADVAVVCKKEGTVSALAVGGIAVVLLLVGILIRYLRKKQKQRVKKKEKGEAQ